MEFKIRIVSTPNLNTCTICHLMSNTFNIFIKAIKNRSLNYDFINILERKKSEVFRKGCDTVCKTIAIITQ